MFPAYAGMIRLGLMTHWLKLSASSVPRLRGDDPFQLYYGEVDEPVFPAYAGMIRQYRCRSACSELGGVPRLRGDDPLWVVA